MNRKSDGRKLMMKIEREETLCLIVDYQERLVPVMEDRDTLIRNANILVKGMNLLEVPMIASQQYTKGIGMTVEEIQHEITPFEYFDKLSFSCCQDEAILGEIKKYNKKNIIVCGIEAHICVLQTVLDLLEEGYHVIVVEDCIGSRKKGDKKVALKRMEKEGAILTTYESILFELTKIAGNDTFKAISKLIK